MAPKTVANERNQAALNLIANNIGGSTEQLRRALARVEAELKADLKGKKEFEDYRTTLLLQRADLEARAARNRAWIAAFERDAADGAFEAQYRRLVGARRGDGGREKGEERPERRERRLPRTLSPSPGRPSTHIPTHISTRTHTSHVHTNTSPRAAEIEAIYAGAKEFHATGIGLLIENFSYHVNFKRWNDTFSAVPFRPK